MLSVGSLELPIGGGSDLFLARTNLPPISADLSLVDVFWSNQLIALLNPPVLNTTIHHSDINDLEDFFQDSYSEDSGYDASGEESEEEDENQNEDEDEEGDVVVTFVATLNDSLFYEFGYQY